MVNLQRRVNAQGSKVCTCTSQCHESFVPHVNLGIKKIWKLVQCCSKHVTNAMTAWVKTDKDLPKCIQFG